MTRIRAILRRGFARVFLAALLILVPPVRGQTTQPAARHRYKKHTLLVGVPPEYVRIPIMEMDPKGIDASGFAIDIMEAIASKLGFELEYRAITDEQRISALHDGEIDLIPFQAISDEVISEVAFSQPLLHTVGVIVTRPGTRILETAEELQRERVGATEGGVATRWLRSFGINAEERGTFEELFPMLQSGEIDYLPCERFQARYIMEMQRISGLRETRIREPSFWRSYAIAVRRDDPSLLADLNDGLELLRQGGVFERHYYRWLNRYEPLERPAAVPLALAAWIGGGLAAVTTIAVAWQLTLRGELRRRAQRLRASEEKYARLFESCQEAALVYLVDGGTVVEANDAACRLYGYRREELLGRPMASLQAGLGTDTIYEVVRAGRVTWHHTRHRRMDGRSIDVEVNATRVEYDGKPAILSFNRDLTDRIRADDEKRRLEAQLQHAQRLESLGILAGGVAHDFNNLLLTIMGHAELAGLKADDPQRVREKLGEIELAATRAADLTQQLLAYAGKARFRIEPVDLTVLATEMTKLLGTRLSTKARLEYETAPELPLIAGDPTLLRQVIMNLLINASDSLNGTEGVIRVRTSVEHFDRPFLSETFVPADIAAGEYVVLEITDTGCGMDEKTMKRIFDPFFSTKFTGRGLGLAVTLRTVQRHRGALKVSSQPGAGTTFRLLLPPAADAARTAIVAPPREVAAAAPAGWALVVDDDASVRDVIRRLLETRNWTVTSASDGESALRVLEGAPTVDLIVLDLTMPGLSGAELVRAVRQRRPATPLLIVSGYSSEELDSRAPEIVVEAFLPKPFSSESLFQGIRDARARIPTQLTL